MERLVIKLPKSECNHNMISQRIFFHLDESYMKFEHILNYLTINKRRLTLIKYDNNKFKFRKFLKYTRFNCII